MVGIVLATLLDEQQTPLLRSFLERDVPGNLFALSVLQKWGVRGQFDAEWWGVFDASDQIVGACYAGAKVAGEGFGLVVPAGDPDANRLIGLALAARGGVRWVIGDRLASDGLWAGLGNPTPRLRSEQILFEATSLTSGSTIDVRKARTSDFEWLCTAASAMVEEDLSLPWAGQDPAVFTARIHAAIKDGAEYVGSVSNRLVYRVERGTRSTYGAQIGGIWVEPDVRGQGLGRAGTRAVCTLLLQNTPRVTMHVRADNMTAIRCYESIGFKAIRAFRLLVR